ncbi:MAG: HAD family hydrolase [Candidatus Thorarchaeota archaeon]
MTPIKALIWDLDGTLIEFKINSIKARRKGLKVLKGYGMPKAKLSIGQSIIENVTIARNYFNKLGFSPTKVDQILKEVNRAVILVEREAAVKANLIQGIDEVLRFAKSQNLKQAIFTYNTHQNTLISIKTVGIDQYFDVIAGRDDIKILKPHPDHLKYICDKLQVSFNEIIVIGDTSRDIEAALNVGCRSIALETHIPIFIDRNLFPKADKIIKPAEIPSGLIQTLKEFL